MATCVLKKVPQAETDIAEAITYLGDRNPRAGWEFCMELDRMLDLIAQFPEWFPLQRRTDKPKYRNVRFAVVRHFGYLIFYKHEANAVIVLRVLHGSMNEP